MRRKILVILITLVMICAVSCVKSENGKTEKSINLNKNYNICISASEENEENDAMRKGFVVGLKDLGLVEDKNVTYHYENAKGNENYAKQIADAFYNQKPDIVVSIGDLATKTIKEKFDDTPVLFLGVADADRKGYCDGSGNPTANLTGVRDSLLIEEQLDFIQKNHTDIKRLGIIYTANNELSQYCVDYFKFFATDKDIDIYTVSIRKSEDVNAALSNILPKVDALTLIPDYIVDNNLSPVINAVNGAGKLIFGSTTTHKIAGADVAVTRDFRLVGEEGAKLARDILSGKKVSEVQVVTVDFKAN